MSIKVKEILRQILVLNNAEKEELIEILGKGIPGVGLEHRSGDFIGESSTGFTTINFAPTPGTCPRCGK